MYLRSKLGLTLTDGDELGILLGTPLFVGPEDGFSDGWILFVGSYEGARLGTPLSVGPEEGFSDGWILSVG